MGDGLMCFSGNNGPCYCCVTIWGSGEGEIGKAVGRWGVVRVYHGEYRLLD